MPGKPPQKPATTLLRRPEIPRASQRPLGLPIVQASTFEIDPALDRAMADGDYRSQFLYTRYNNPTVDALQRRLAELHRGEDAVCTSSGMAAISSALFALTQAGDAIVADARLYGQTHTLLTEFLAGAGRAVTFAPFDDAEALERALAAAAEGGREVLAYAETFANPLATPLDLPRAAGQARSAGATFIVDNTFASPLVCQPLAHGAHVVVESLTKSIAGHSDVVGGAVITDAARGQRVWRAMLHLGGCMDPHAAFLVWRGMKTLAMRTETASKSARALAEALRGAPGVADVWYPDTEGKPWLEGSGSMLAFSLRGGDAAAHRALDAFTVVTAATSLGGVESLACLPYNTSHRTPEARQSVGLAPGTVRLSVGCEAEEDLIADVLQAVATATAD